MKENGDTFDSSFLLIYLYSKKSFQTQQYVQSIQINAHSKIKQTQIYVPPHTGATQLLQTSIAQPPKKPY